MVREERTAEGRERGRGRNSLLVKGRTGQTIVCDPMMNAKCVLLLS